MTQPLAINRLQTAARHLAVTTSATNMGGLIKTHEDKGIVWGAFTTKPIKTRSLGVSDNDYFSEALFVCRRQGALKLGDILSIHNTPWRIVTLSPTDQGDCQFGLEKETA